jgi:hypothetical protein
MNEDRFRKAQELLDGRLSETHPSTQAQIKLLMHTGKTIQIASIVEGMDLSAYESLCLASQLMMIPDR